MPFKVNLQPLLKVVSALWLAAGGPPDWTWLVLATVLMVVVGVAIAGTVLVVVGRTVVQEATRTVIRPFLLRLGEGLHRRSAAERPSPRNTSRRTTKIEHPTRAARQLDLFSNINRRDNER